MGHGSSKSKLTEFRRKKLLHEFHTFYDVNKDGRLEADDFNMARENICKLSGWKPGSEKYNHMQALFRDMWLWLDQAADENGDGAITADEWVRMWTNQADLFKTDVERRVHMPDWLDKYAEYKFSLYDRAGDGVIDEEEFEYILSEFNIPAKSSRAAFTMLSKNNEKKVDLDYFKELVLEYYQSDDRAVLGNFINGVLDFEDT